MCVPVRLTGGAAMIELTIIERNIAHYEGLLKLDLDDKERSIVMRWLTEAKEKLACDQNTSDQPKGLAG
jgi:hypothetical protein